MRYIYLRLTHLLTYIRRRSAPFCEPLYYDRGRTLLRT